MIAIKDNESNTSSFDEQASKSSIGQLIIIGGAEDKEGDCTILREFIRRAGGRKAKIVVMTTATSLPVEVGENYSRVFRDLGVNTIDIVDTKKREDGDNERDLELIENSTGVFFTGGDSGSYY